MEPFRTILFAADFSDRSREAFRVACSLGDEKTRVHILHVAEGPSSLEPPIVAGELGVEIPLGRDHKERHQAIRTHLAEVYLPPRPVEVAYETVDGIAAEEIVKAAENLGAELIVLGTHGRKGVRRLLAGSVAETVLRNARCPVLALRSPELPHPADEIRTILHPTDFSDDSAPALEVARSIAKDRGARLVVLHVAPNDGVVEGAVVPVDLDPYRKALETLRARFDGSDLKYPLEIRLCQGEDAIEIVRTAAELECDLIVMGSHGRTGLHRLLMGSVAEDVLRRCACPALVVKPTRREPAHETAPPAKYGVTIF